MNDANNAGAPSHARFAGDPVLDVAWSVNLTDEETVEMKAYQLAWEFQRGALHPEDVFVWREGMADWVPVGSSREVEALVHAFTSRNSAPVQPQGGLMAGGHAAASQAPMPQPAPDFESTVMMDMSAHYDAEDQTIVSPVPVTAIGQRAGDHPLAGTLKIAELEEDDLTTTTARPYRPAAGVPTAAPAAGRPPSPPQLTPADQALDTTHVVASPLEGGSSRPPAARSEARGARDENSVLFSLESLGAKPEKAQPSATAKPSQRKRPPPIRSARPDRKSAGVSARPGLPQGVQPPPGIPAAGPAGTGSQSSTAQVVGPRGVLPQGIVPPPNAISPGPVAVDAAPIAPAPLAAPAVAAGPADSPLTVPFPEEAEGLAPAGMPGPELNGDVQGQSPVAAPSPFAAGASAGPPGGSQLEPQMAMPAPLAAQPSGKASVGLIVGGAFAVLAAIGGAVFFLAVRVAPEPTATRDLPTAGVEAPAPETAPIEPTAAGEKSAGATAPAQGGGDPGSEPAADAEATAAVSAEPASADAAPGFPAPGNPATNTGSPPPTSSPKPEPSAKEPEPKPKPLGPFNRGAARAALSSAAGSASGCKKKGGPTGRGRVTVTFAPSGRASQASVGAPFGGTAVGRCAAGIFRSASVPPFKGDPTTVSKSFFIK